MRIGMFCMLLRCDNGDTLHDLPVHLAGLSY
jgi:hypothetical protein